MISRGKNFTEREKSNLLGLIHKYKHIIENKCTNKVWTVTKHKTWEIITAAFNKNAEVPRTKKQLHTAYLNLKRSTRQGISIDTKVPLPPEVDAYTPVLSCIETELLDESEDRVTPLCNNSDSVSSYDKIDEDVKIIKALQGTSVPISQQTQNIRNTRKLQLKKKKCITNDTLIKQYYNVKLQCAIIEKRSKLLEYRLNLRKQKLLDLEIKIKQKEYEKLLNE